MADNTDNRDGQGGEELPDDLKRLVDAAEEDAADAGEQDVEQPEPGHTVTSGPVSEEDKARSLIDMSTAPSSRTQTAAKAPPFARRIWARRWLLRSWSIP